MAIKKVLLLTAFLACTSVYLTAAACGSFNLANATFSCQATSLNGASWTVTDWGLSGAFQIGYSSTINASNINVAVTSTLNGFDVTFTSTVNPANGNNFFSLNGGNQQVNFKTSFWIMPTTGGPYGNVNSANGIDDVSLRMLSPTGTNFYSVQKLYQDFSAVNLSVPSQVIYSGTNLGCNQAGNASCFILATTNPSSPVNFANRTAGFQIVDNVQFNAGETGSGSIVGYVNSFSITPPQQVATPEPMSFVLMFGGLGCIAGLRRHKS